ncbi:MAG: UvrB/UvrC motif-containing protein [Christensenellaceae bacterium]|jgi:protein arginine kinase activator|nr:UvrB/UvrC motif-containing protein [Christensenellaceae bacterium]
MLCEECGINTANVRFTTVMGGKVYEKRLCAQCLAKKKHELAEGISVGDLLSGFLHESAAMQEENLVCPGCKMSYEDFKRGGRFGCARCYESFKPYLEPMLSKIHGRVKHAGKVPRAHAVRQSDEEVLQILKSEMERAVEVEDFERAAKLRDEIKEFKGEG